MERRVRVGRPSRPDAPRLTAEQVAQFDELGFVVLEGVFTDDELAPVIAATDALDAATDRFLAERDGGRFSIAERGAITFSLFPVLADDAARAFAEHQVFTDLCHDLVGARRSAVPRPGGVQAAREAPSIPVAPGQRVHVRRAAAVPHVLGRLDRRDARQRMPAHRARPSPARHAAPPLHRSARVGDLRGSPRCDRRAGRQGRRRRVLVAVAASHRAEHDRCDAQGVHPPVRARRCAGLPW